MLDSLLSLHSSKEIVLLTPNIALAKSLGFQAIEHNAECVRLHYLPASLEVRGIVCGHVFNLLTPKRLFLSLNFFQTQKRPSNDDPFRDCVFYENECFNKEANIFAEYLMNR